MPPKRRGGNKKKKRGAAKPKQEQKEEERKCDNPVCDKTGAQVNRKCARCNNVFYCSDECSFQHWEQGHKQACIPIFDENVVPDTNHPTNIGLEDNGTDWQGGIKMNRKILKETGGNFGDYVLIPATTAYGKVKPGEPLPDGVPSNFHLKQHAFICNYSGRQSDDVNASAGILKHEKVYQKYFEELVKNKAEWMRFFSHPQNNDHVEHTFAILVTLAKIYRVRGDLDSVSHGKCEEVLDMEEEILPIYQASCNALLNTSSSNTIWDMQGIFSSFEILRYDYYSTRFGLYITTDRLRLATPYFRKCLEYEAEKNYEPSQQKFLPIMRTIHLEPTFMNVRNLSPLQVQQMVMNCSRMLKISHNSNAARNIRGQVELKKCEACNKTESAIGEFKACSRCLKVNYCSRDCQKNHYKIHKKICNKKKK